MKTWKQIRNELIQFGRKPKSKQYRQGTVTGWTVINQPGGNRVLHKITVQGKSKIYEVEIAFHNIQFKDAQESKKDIKAKITGKYGIGYKKTMWYKQPRLDKNKAMIRSDDPDFRFRFMKELASNNNLYNNPNAWIRYDAEKEDKEKGNKNYKEIIVTKMVKGKKKKITKRIKKKYYMVTHPQGGTYKRATPHPKDGGRPFMNPKGLMGYSYPVAAALKYLQKNGLLK